MANFWKKLPRPFLALAPMQDVTDFVFREIVTDCAKPDVLFTEFTNVDALTSRGYENAVRNFRYSEKQRSIVAQIWGTDPKNFFQTAQIIRKLKFDGVDINMGCPDRAVVKGGGGSALIKTPKLAKEIISAVKKGAGDMAVSVKTRLGFDKIITDEWISFLFKQKLDALIIHGRIAKKKSEGLANWDEIEKVVLFKNSISPETIIVGNGDVKSYKQALKMHKKYKVDGVMIGRGVFANPWIFEKTVETKKRTKNEYLELLLKHAKLYHDTWGDTKNFAVMKKFFKVYVKGFAGANELRQNLMMCENYFQVKKLVDDSCFKNDDR